MPTFLNGSLAQPVEQLAFNQLVARSNRARPTILVSLNNLSYNKAAIYAAFFIYPKSCLNIRQLNGKPKFLHLLWK